MQFNERSRIDTPLKIEDGSGTVNYVEPRSGDITNDFNYPKDLEIADVNRNDIESPQFNKRDKIYQEILE